MIIDIESNFNNVNISYFDAAGKIKLKKIKLDKIENWVVCQEKDIKKSDKYRNRDGKPVKKQVEKSLNKFSLYELIKTLPKEDYDEVSALNFPQIQSIDIETEVIDGFPKPEIAKERITCIAIAYENNTTVVLGRKPITPEQERDIYNKFAEYLKEFGDWKFKYINFADEYNMLNSFICKILPTCSLVTGWNYSNFDWLYITNRCKRLNINIENASPTKKITSRGTPYHIPMIDYMDAYQKWDRTVDVKESDGLDWVSNRILGVNKLKYEGTLQQLYEQDYDKYVLYNAIDAALVILIHSKLKTMNVPIAIATLCNVSLYTAFKPVPLTEALLWRGYWDNDLVVADKRLEIPKGQYEGAYIMDVEPGIYLANACFDFASLYPSVMREFNISPDSWVGKFTNEETLEKYRQDKDFIVTDTDSVFKAKDSVLKKIMTDLYAKRRFYKDRFLVIDEKLQMLKIKKGIK